MSSRLPGWMRASPTLVVGASLLALLLIISRQPSAIFNPQLFAEDGKVWFQNAYQFGPFQPLVWPYAGYLETFQRMAGAAALLLPLSLVPLFFAWVSLVVQVLPVAFLASDRLAPQLPRRWVRLLVALGYLAVPGTIGMGADVTNTEWYLAVLAVMVVLAPRSHRPWWQAFDLAVVTLSGLTGPFCIFLAPAALVLAWIRRTRSQIAVGAVVLGLAVLQAGVLVVNLPVQRSVVLVPVHVSLLVGLEMVATRMVMVPILGTPVAYYATQIDGLVVPVLVLAMALVMLTIALARGTVEQRLAIAVGMITLAAALVVQRRLWTVMLHTNGASRYWIFPMLSWLAILAIVAFRARLRWARPLAVILLSLTLLVGVPSDWEYPAVQNRHFQLAAAEFGRARPGQSVRFQEEPRGWSFLLTKR